VINAEPRVLIRADGSHALGMGHIYRTLNLADALCSWAKVSFLTREDVVAAAKLSEKYPTETARDDDEEYAIIRAARPDVIIVDKLNTDATYMKKLKNLSRVLVSFDDCGKGVYETDLAFNVLYHCDTPHKTNSKTRFFTEPSYAIINPRFSEAHRRKTREPLRILVTLGGADTLGLTPGVIETLDSLPEEFVITAVIGPAFKHYTELEKAIAGCTRRVDVRFNVSDMWNVMGESDLAISAGGNTLFELAATGTPAVVLCEELFEVETADRMMKSGTCENLGYSKQVDSERLRQTTQRMINDQDKRKKMGLAGKKLIDGHGPERVSEIIRNRISERNKLLSA
jgi:spore coat polysaccharide biosynthesis predicted glycosyltransferase SpsG